MQTPGADGGELPGRRRGLAKVIGAPAGDGAVPPHPAGVENPGADGGELPGRRRGPAIAIIAPAGDGAVPPHPAGVETPGADGGELDFHCSTVSGACQLGHDPPRFIRRLPGGRGGLARLRCHRLRSGLAGEAVQYPLASGLGHRLGGGLRSGSGRNRRAGGLPGSRGGLARLRGLAPGGGPLPVGAGGVAAPTGGEHEEDRAKQDGSPPGKDRPAVLSFLAAAGCLKHLRLPPWCRAKHPRCRQGWL